MTSILQFLTKFNSWLRNLMIQIGLIELIESLTFKWNQN